MLNKNELISLENTAIKGKYRDKRITLNKGYNETTFIYRPGTVETGSAC